MAQTPQQVGVGAAKFNGFDDRVIRLGILYLLQQIAGNKMTANQLAVAAAKACFNCSDDRSMWVQALYLLNQIQANGSTGGGGGGSGSVLQGAIDPVAAPATPGSPALYTNLTSGVLWTWNVTTQTWV
jgi:hypothetical protein